MKLPKAKTTSLLGEIVASSWIALWSAYNFWSQIQSGKSLQVEDIIFSGVSIAACFAPVYFSIILDKIIALKTYKKGE